MRKELEPNREVAEKLYPQIKELIEEYTEYCDEYGDEENIEYKKLENKLHEMTGKDISQYNLSEYWEGEGLEVLSFRISLPDPNVVYDITKEELTEMIRRLKQDSLEVNSEVNDENDFKELFNCYLGDYYRKLLEVNFKKYKHGYFNRQKGKNGEYFEYEVDEIAEKLWDKK